VTATTAAEAAPSWSDDERRRGLRRMKAIATGLLLVAAAVYVAARRWEDGGPAAAGYLRAAAEAGMIGALADWFAVTALFRHPLGLPIPHTALVPTRKDALGRSLGDFVSANFLSAEVVRDRLDRVDLATRVGRWLQAPQHAARVVAEAAAALRAAVGLLRDEDLQSVVEQALRRRVARVPLAPPLGRLLARVVADRAHHAMVDLVVRHGHRWLRDNPDLVVRAVERQAPSWSPRFLDEKVAGKVYAELLRVAGELERDPRHPAREALDRYLAALAQDLQHDAGTGRAVDRVVAGLMDNAELRAALGRLVVSGREALLELVDDEDSELRLRATTAVTGLGERLTADADLRERVAGWVAGAATYATERYGGEIASVISDTVARWDAAEASDRIEQHVGRDLQFIRINGTVVGALAGVVIHAVSTVLL
jgi:uncharacterized membrane-anchored protein YjiN (DUF445 family)